MVRDGKGWLGVDRHGWNWLGMVVVDKGWLSVLKSPQKLKYEVVPWCGGGVLTDVTTEVRTLIYSWGASSWSYGPELPLWADAKWNVMQRFISPKVMWAGVGGVFRFYWQVESRLTSCWPRPVMCSSIWTPHRHPCRFTRKHLYNFCTIWKREGNWENASFEQEEIWSRTRNGRPAFGSVTESWTFPLKFTENPNYNFLKLSEVNVLFVSKC